MHHDESAGSIARCSQDLVAFGFSFGVLVCGTNSVGEDDLDLVPWATDGRIRPMACSSWLGCGWTSVFLRSDNLASRKGSVCNFAKTGLRTLGLVNDGGLHLRHHRSDFARHLLRLEGEGGLGHPFANNPA